MYLREGKLKLQYTQVSYRVFWWGGKKFVGHCHSIMHEYDKLFFEYETYNF